MYALMCGHHVFMSETSYSIGNIVSVRTIKVYKGWGYSFAHS
jgi:hypothetical protein